MKIVTVGGKTGIADNIIVNVVIVHPGKTIGKTVPLPEGRKLFVKLVQFFDKELTLLMGG